MTADDLARIILMWQRTGPGDKYLLGADEFGRDILSRVIYGSRVALLVGVLSMLIALVGGLLLGTLAGFIGGWLDAVLMRGVEILLAFPYLLLALAIVAMLGPGVQPPTASWGLMVSTGRDVLLVAPHVATVPGLAIMLAVLAFNLVGDGLRDALDPRLRGAA